MIDENRWRDDARAQDDLRGDARGGYAGGGRGPRDDEERERERWMRGHGDRDRDDGWRDDRGRERRDAWSPMQGVRGRGGGYGGTGPYGSGGAFGPMGYGYGRGAYERSRDEGTRDWGREHWSRAERADRDDRGMWDRARDEVSSWFGDDDAERRRRMDQQAEHRGRGPKGYRRSDDRIREDVNDRLTDDPWVDASEIEVVVKDCEVTLSGTVRQRGDKRRAEDLAERVSGVQHVQNNLRVQPSAAGVGLGGIPEGSTTPGLTSTGGTTSSTTQRATRSSG